MSNPLVLPYQLKKITDTVDPYGPDPEGIPTSDFPALKEIVITDLVGPGATNRQHRAIARRTETLRDHVNGAITVLNLLTGKDAGGNNTTRDGNPYVLLRDGSVAMYESTDAEEITFNMNGNRIVNLAPGTQPADAVNLAQLTEATGTSPDTTGFLKRNGSNEWAAAGVDVGPLKMGLNQIKNVAAATDDNDAVIKSQLDAISAPTIVTSKYAYQTVKFTLLDQMAAASSFLGQTGRALFYTYRNNATFGWSKYGAPPDWNDTAYDGSTSAKRWNQYPAVRIGQKHSTNIGLKLAGVPVGTRLIWALCGQDVDEGASTQTYLGLWLGSSLKSLCGSYRTKAFNIDPLGYGRRVNHKWTWLSIPVSSVLEADQNNYIIGSHGSDESQLIAAIAYTDNPWDYSIQDFLLYNSSYANTLLGFSGTPNGTTPSLAKSASNVVNESDGTYMNLPLSGAEPGSPRYVRVDVPIADTTKEKIFWMTDCSMDSCGRGFSVQINGTVYPIRRAPSAWIHPLVYSPGHWKSSGYSFYCVVSQADIAAAAAAHSIPNMIRVYIRSDDYDYDNPVTHKCGFVTPL